MKLRLGLAVIAAVCVATPCAAGAGAEVAPPTFWVESSHLEVGPVSAGSTAVATFVFRNEGDKAVRIIRAAPS